jgi:hypothetical protein
VHLDRAADEKLEWTADEVRNPFYVIRVTATDEKASSWSAEALPRSPSYRSFSVVVPSGAKPGDAVEVRQARGARPGG